MKRIVFIVGTFLLLGLHPLNTGAVTIVPVKDAPTSPPVVMTQQSGVVYLLRWQENRLMTTRGTFLTDGIQIVNESGIEKEKIASQAKPLIVEFMKEGNTIVKITILQNP